ncbi:hypothetical protein ABE26_11600 [Cytobacillus firmus]|nr:hypothetical protein [Cytobacillus firmus]
MKGQFQGAISHNKVTPWNYAPLAPFSSLQTLIYKGLCCSISLILFIVPMTLEKRIIEMDYIFDNFRAVSKQFNFNSNTVGRLKDFRTINPSSPPSFSTPQKQEIWINDHDLNPIIGKKYGGGVFLKVLEFYVGCILNCLSIEFKMKTFI